MVEFAPRWRRDGLNIHAVRLDSGDLAQHAFQVRKILDAGGLSEVRIFASGHLDEYELQRLVNANAPIDGFGIGTRLDTSADAPYLDCAYKIQEYAGRPRRKRSSDLGEAGTLSPQWAITRARCFIDADAPLIMIESEGITESVKSWRTDVPAQFATALGLEHIMFEAAEPAVFSWYVKNFGPEVNLFVDHSQIVQLEALRRGLWGTADLWGRVVTFKED